MKNRWHVVYTYPQFEKAITDKLLQMNVDAYLPCQEVLRQWSDRKKKVNIPLFPNYVFVNVSSVNRYKVLTVMGVTRFIAFNGQPATLSDMEISSIRRLTENRYDVMHENFYAVGDPVKVVDGPLIGLKGLLVGKKGSQRFMLRLNSIERAVSIDIHISCLEIIK